MRNFTAVKRLVVKIGTNVLSGNNGVERSLIYSIARQISEIVRQKKQVILVSSGAIGMGAKALGILKPLQDVRLRQACAAVGQGILMGQYQEIFAKFGQTVAQVLLTNRILSYRKNYVNLKNTVETLLKMAVVPIINENDSVSIDEIDLAFGDNDKLSALVASKIDAELLIILTDVDGLFETDPRRDTHAKRIPLVTQLTPEIEAIAGAAGTTLGTGGMKTKIEAVKIASQAGCRVVLADGRQPNVISGIIAGKEIGTLFLPWRRLSNRKRWILNATPNGALHIDSGAEASLRSRRSLLLVGITAIEGTFEKGQIVNIGKIARGICDYSSENLREMLEEQHYTLKQTRKKSNIVVHGNNIVMVE